MIPRDQRHRFAHRNPQGADHAPARRHQQPSCSELRPPWCLRLIGPEQTDELDAAVVATTTRAVTPLHRRDPARISAASRPGAAGALGQRAGVGDRERGSGDCARCTDRFDSRAPGRYRWVLDVELSSRGVMSLPCRRCRGWPPPLGGDVAGVHAGGAGKEGQRYAATRRRSMRSSWSCADADHVTQSLDGPIVVPRAG